MIKGDIIHNIIQITLKKMIHIIEYLFYHKYNKQKDIEDVIFEVLHIVKDKIIESYEIKNFYGEIFLDSSKIDKIFTDVEKMLKNCSKLIKTVLNIHENYIETTIIDDELKVTWLFANNLLINGKIDLIGYEKKAFNLIEIKSGNRYQKDQTQLQLYGIILKKKYPNLKINLNLWYPKLSSRPTSISIPKNKNMLKEIKKNSDLAMNLINKQTKIDHIGKASDYECYKNFCKICEKYEKIIQKTLKGNTLSSFL